ncbi:MAG TPA: hypothetical protein VGJ26_21065 [Pirellulales bacterium]
MNTSSSFRRWFQFSLGSLFWLTLFAATAAFAFREHRELKRLEEKLAPYRNQLTLVLGGGLEVHDSVPDGFDDSVFADPASKPETESR